jgi:hypothetical protein
MFVVVDVAHLRWERHRLDLRVAPLSWQSDVYPTYSRSDLHYRP